MGKNQKDKLSVFISLVLRHQPDAAGIALDEHGWADVEELLEGIRKTGRSIDRERLEEIVRTDEKGRYSFNEDKTLIRANQGHSIPVDVELTEAEPPSVLYHGTASRFAPSILSQGLKPMSRDGISFYLSQNGVWLTKYVEPKYLRQLDEASVSG